MSPFQQPLTDPMTVRLLEGEIVVLGPDGVAISMTIDAADESAVRLAAAVRQARAAEADGKPI